MTAPITRPAARTILVRDVATNAAATPTIPAKLEPGDKLVGNATLTAGALAITLPGIKAASSFVSGLSRKVPAGTLGTGGVKAVITDDTLTLTAIDTAGALSNADTSTLVYEVTV